MKAPFARFAQTALGVSALVALSAAPALAQTVAVSAPTATPKAAQTPATPKHKAHRHKTPNLEMDLEGSGEAADVAGPTTTTENALAPNDMSGSTGASASFVQYPPPELPQSPAATPEPAASDGATPRV